MISIQDMTVLPHNSKQPLQTYKGILTLALLLLLAFTKGQAQQVDSLETVLNRKDLSVKERIQTLYLLSRQLTYIDNLKSLEYGEQALALASQENDRPGMAYAYRILGSIYAINENYFTSIQYVQKALDIFHGLKDEEGIANCYISLGHIYRNLQQHAKEIEYHQKSVEIFRSLGLKERIGVTVHNLGESYFYAGDIERATVLTEEAVRINDSMGNAPVLSNCLKVLGLIYLNQGAEAKAEVHFQNAVQISEDLGAQAQKIAWAESLLRLAQIHGNKGDHNQQFEYLQQVVELSLTYNLNDYLGQSYQQLALYHIDREQPNEAKGYLALHEANWQDIQIRQKRDRSRLTEGMMEIDHLSIKASELEKENTAQQLALKIRNRTLLVAGISFVILHIILFKLWKLHKKLRSRHEIIESQREELETMNATKDKFFSIVAHDIRGPLDSLKAFTTLLLEHFDEMTREEVQQMGKHLDRSVDSTLQLANNLIIWARNQMNELKAHQKEFLLPPIATQIKATYGEVAQQKHIDLQIECAEDTSLWGDPDQIEFIIRNLVNNAIKYTQRGGRVLLQVHKPDKGGVRILISDNGIGMDPKAVEHLFAVRTQKTRKGTAGEMGSGLGLALSYEFLQLNQGNIEVESAPNKGTTFTLTLPDKARAA